MARLTPTANEKEFFIHPSRYCHIKEANHHFVIRLVTPHDRTVRVRIVGIVGRVVVPGNSLKGGSRFQRTRFRESITQLPVEVIVHSQERFYGPIRTHEIVFKFFAPKMHVGEETQQQGIVGQGAMHFDAVVIGVRGNRHRIAIIRQLQSQNSLCRTAFLSATNLSLTL